MHGAKLNVTVNTNNQIVGLRMTLPAISSTMAARLTRGTRKTARKTAAGTLTLLTVQTPASKRARMIFIGFPRRVVSIRCLAAAPAQAFTPMNLFTSMGSPLAIVMTLQARYTTL